MVSSHGIDASYLFDLLTTLAGINGQTNTAERERIVLVDNVILFDLYQTQVESRWAVVTAPTCRTSPHTLTLTLTTSSLSSPPAP
jgi:hypothetical protein